MDAVGGMLLTLLGASVLGGIITTLTLAPGANLASRFRSLGNMTGKTKQEIVAAAGVPSSVSQMGDGVTLLQWQATGYHIAIRFKDDVFDGITHEFAAQN